MTLRLSQLTSPEAVQAALDEFVRSGQQEFLEKYGFKQANSYVVRDPRTGIWADSKAIAGVALSYQFPGSGGLAASEFSGGQATVLRRLELLGFAVRRRGDVERSDWRPDEVAAIVADYLAMLTTELAGQSLNKTAHRKQLLQRLAGRSESAIEFKHANISAVMLELGYPYIKGYQPRSNFQRSLVDEVVLQISGHAVLDEAALSAVQRPALAPTIDDFSRVRAPVPERRHEVREREANYGRVAIQRDYLAREALNRSLGRAGEEFAVRFERWRLANAGAARLADRVEQVSVTKGDGLGYDIQSFETDGQPRFIEVKTTTFGDRTPFFLSSNELSFSRQTAGAFRLYRLFDFRASPRMFELAGPVDQHCALDPTTYRASFG